MRLLPARRRAGFTLLELTIVLLVLGILTGIAVTSIGGAASAVDVRRVEDELISDLRVARMRAMGCGGGEPVKVNLETDGWEIVNQPCGDGIERASQEGVVITSSGDVTFTYPLGELKRDVNPIKIESTGSDGACRQVSISKDSGRITSGPCGG